MRENGSESRHSQTFVRLFRRSGESATIARTSDDAATKTWLPKLNATCREKSLEILAADNLACVGGKLVQRIWNCSDVACVRNVNCSVEEVRVLPPQICTLQRRCLIRSRSNFVNFNSFSSRSRNFQDVSTLLQVKVVRSQKYSSEWFQKVNLSEVSHTF